MEVVLYTPIKWFWCFLFRDWCWEKAVWYRYGFDGTRGEGAGDREDIEGECVRGGPHSIFWNAVLYWCCITCGNTNVWIYIRLYSAKGKYTFFYFLRLGSW